ncbi:beta-ketoacyl-[acyl-carrier-protein] synthase family protein [Streptomyces avicenniae]|uniref:beta-ketoacyl-[acyl-carrier-protein] synthase family protein n=1 Tax=Streptomyces avicenniae TaxID=500153 RepID=UPI00069ACB55|nr:beta-ketoacyl-[acyl-carrier-protein] synthase family protein [Streptomyces avicenniae]
MTGDGTADVAVTGLGLVTPGGIGVPGAWDAVCRGLPTARHDPELACSVRDFDGDGLLGRRLARRLDRVAQFAVVAAREAVTMAGLAGRGWDARRVAVLFGASGSSFQGLTDAYPKLLAGRTATISPLLLPRSLPNAPAAEVALDLGARGPAFATSAGCASAPLAVGIARDLLRSGALDVIVAGAAESLLHPLTTAGFARLGVVTRSAARPFDAARDGFVPAEGAGVLVLERAGYARARRAQVLAWLAGHGAAGEAHHPTAPHPDGTGAEHAVRAALAAAGREPRAVEHVNAHGAATRGGDSAEAVALARLLPHRPPVTATKGTLGHAGAGSGAIETVVTALSLRDQLIPPTAGLTRPDPAFSLDVVTGAPWRRTLRTAVSVSTALGGQNAALLLLAA